MFTGIIEEMGYIEAIKKGEKSSRFRIKAQKVLEKTKLGESICTNGVCLTASHIERNCFEADVMAETLRKSNLGGLKIGSLVNLERALKLEDRLGGHLVSGHIDGIGFITEKVKEDNAQWLSIQTDEALLRYIVLKGSIAIDGVSLTVAKRDDKTFKVSLIPHTGKETILLTKNKGETVNLECDMLAKYIESLLGIPTVEDKLPKESINEDFLRLNGFL